MRPKPLRRSFVPRRGPSKIVLCGALTLTLALTGCKDGSDDTSDVGSSSAALSAADKTAFDFFLAKGLSPVQAAGIVGNLDQESGMDPTISQYGGGPGRGIAQWSAGGRWDTDGNDNVVWYAANHGASKYSLNLQLEFIWYELTTFSGYGLAPLRAATTIADATVAFEVHFEGCGQCVQSTRINDAQAAYNAYSNDPVTPPPPPPPPDAPPRGFLDTAGCSGIVGWAQDPDTAASPINVDVYFDAPAGQKASGAFRLTADVARNDLCTAIGSCAHGFSTPVPVSLMDGAGHTVFAYGIDAGGKGSNPLLGGSPKTFLCPVPALPPANAAIKRHVQNPTSLAAWKFDPFRAIAHEPAEAVNLLPDGDPLPLTPEAVRDPADPSGAVYVIDGAEKRHVVDPASLDAWQLAVAPTTPAMLSGATAGRDWPAKPFLIEDPTGTVYVLDSLPASGDPTTGAPTPATGSDVPGAPGSQGTQPPAGGDQPAASTDSGNSGGCSAAPGTPASTRSLAFLAGLALAISARRRRPTH